MELTRLIVKGGVISPGELRDIVNMGLEQGLKDFSFGSRQDIIFPNGFTNLENAATTKHHVIFPDEKSGNNIVSSYVSTDIIRNTNWLTGNKFLYILEQFKEQPALKVNITDPKQQLVPLFTGHINFIASEHEDYWFLYIRLPNWERMEVYPVLIYSWDIAKIYYQIEKIVSEESYRIDLIFSLVSEALDTNNRTIDKPLTIPFYPFPYYEGMNRLGIDQYWLEIIHCKGNSERPQIRLGKILRKKRNQRASFAAGAQLAFTCCHGMGAQFKNIFSAYLRSI